MSITKYTGKEKLPVPNLILTSKLKDTHGCYTYEKFTKKEITL